MPAFNADQANQGKLLEQLVNINSGTLNSEGVHRLGCVAAPIRGARVYLPCDSDGRSTACRSYGLRTQGTHGKRVVLIGHMDTVFEADSISQKFKRTGEGKATRPGSSDMKGGLVITLGALKALNENHDLDGTTITVFLSGDEERPGLPLSIARCDLITAGKESDAALEFEGGVQTQGHDAASISQRSAYTWELKTTGKTAHSSSVFRPERGWRGHP